MENFDKKIKVFRYWAIGLAIFGGSTLIFFLILFGISGMLFGRELNPIYSSTMGTFIGGTVGAIWTLTGVLLYYAALMSQRQELSIALQSRNDLKNAYDKQIQNAEFQKFQQSFFELLRFLNNIKGTLNKDEWFDDLSPEPQKTNLKLNLHSRIYHSFERLGGFINLEGIKKEQYLRGLRPTEFPGAEDFATFCETFYLIIQECNHLYQINPLQAETYERIVLVNLDINLVKGIILYGATMPNHDNKLWAYVINSDAWNRRFYELHRDWKGEMIIWRELNPKFEPSKFYF